MIETRRNLDANNESTALARSIEARRSWAARMIQRCSTRPPAYGSTEWLLMPDGPDKVAAVVIAAECNARHDDDLVENLRTEIELAARAHKAAEDDAYLARRDAHRDTWGNLRLIRGGAYADSAEFRGGNPS